MHVHNVLIMLHRSIVPGTFSIQLVFTKPNESPIYAASHSLHHKNKKIKLHRFRELSHPNPKFYHCPAKTSAQNKIHC